MRGNQNFFDKIKAKRIPNEYDFNSFFHDKVRTTILIKWNNMFERTLRKFITQQMGCVIILWGNITSNDLLREAKMQ